MGLSKSIFISMVFMLAAFTAQAAKTISIDVENRVWLGIDGHKETLGNVETLKKGTLLYHWANATPEQAKAWNDAGHISPALLERLKTGQGFVGGGFYVSNDPIDSQGYGNTLVVIELQKDIQFLRTNNHKGWNDLWPEFARNQISGLSVAHTKNWLNIVDADALTKEHVADAGLFKSFTPKKLPSLIDIDSLLTRRFPELQNDPVYKKISEKVHTLMKDLQSKTAQSPIALAEIFKNGSDALKYDAIAAIMSDTKDNPAFSKENILTLLKESEIDNKFAIPRRVTENIAHTFRWLITNKNPESDFVLEHSTSSRYVLKALLTSISELPPERASRLLQEAYYNLGDNKPSDLIAVIDRLKREGKWNPPVMCQGVFR